MTIITFTGHRDVVPNPEQLDEISRMYPDALWIQGGAEGVDSIVEIYCETYHIRHLTIRPDYRRYGGKAAPIARNREMVDACDLVIAFWDGRKHGGTWFTIEYAREQGKEVKLYEPMRA